MNDPLARLEKGAHALERVGAGCGWTLLYIVSLLLIALGIYIGKENLALVQKGSRTVGQVVELREVPPDQDGGVTWKPILNYRIADREYVYESQVSSDPPAHRVGDRVELLVDPAHPDRAKIDSLMELWFLPAACGLSGLVVGIVVIVVNLRGMRKRRERRVG